MNTKSLITICCRRGAIKPAQSLRWPLATFVVATLVSLGLPARAAGGSGPGTGTLQLSGSALSGRLTSVLDCPSGDHCFLTTTHGRVPGLGRVSEKYVNFVEASGTQCERWHSSPVLQVPGKGSVDLSVQTPLGSCIDATVTGEIHAHLVFTVTGGTGDYVGASGSGMLLTVGDPSMGIVTDRLSGTLNVPGFGFDTTPPVISGAVSKTVLVGSGVKRVRVTFHVTAVDAVDGAIPVSCVPHSRSFKVGRTRVTCSATDSSANTAIARFTVTVKHGH